MPNAAKKALRRVRSKGEAIFALHRGAYGIDPPEREYRFCARRWRFDFAWPEKKIAVEIEGGTWSRGRHVRGKGYEADLEKYNAAAEQGWRVFRYTTKQVESGAAIQQIARVFNDD